MKKLVVTFGVFLSIVIICFAFKSTKSPEYYYEKGEEKYNEQDFKKAIIFYSRAIKLKPEYIDAIWKRGLSNVKIDSNMLAIKDFTKIIDIKPNGDVYNERGKVKFYIKDTLGACADWDVGCDLMSNRACELKRKICN